MKLLALETLRDYYLLMEEQENFKEMDDAWRKLKREVRDVMLDTSFSPAALG